MNRERWIQRRLWPDFQPGVAPDPILPKAVLDYILEGVPLAEPEGNPPFLYSRRFLRAVIEACCLPGSRFSEAFQFNLRRFYETFLSQTYPSVSYESIWGPTKSRHPNFFKDTDELPFATRPRTFMHGRFNVIHPGHLETACLLREGYPDYEVWIGVDHNATSQRRGQVSFMNPQFRASMWAVTGLVDDLILLEPPDPQTTHPGDVDGWRDADRWWDYLYADSPLSINPTIVVSDERLAQIKWLEISSSHLLTIEDMDKKWTALHGSSIAAGKVSVAIVQAAWDYVKGLLEKVELRPLV